MTVTRRIAVTGSGAAAAANQRDDYECCRILHSVRSYHFVIAVWSAIRQPVHAKWPSRRRATLGSSSFERGLGTLDAPYISTETAERSFGVRPKKDGKSAFSLEGTGPSKPQKKGGAVRFVGRRSRIGSAFSTSAPI